MTRRRTLRRAALGLAVVSLSCILPGEPSDADRVRFEFQFTEPFRVPLRGSAVPTLRISAAGRVLLNPSYRLESEDQTVVQVARSGLDSSAAYPDPAGHVLWGLSHRTGRVRVLYAALTGTADTTFQVQVVVSAVRILQGEDTNAAFTRLRQTAQLSAAAFDARGDRVPNTPVTWSSSDSAVATVDPIPPDPATDPSVKSAVVTARDEGTALITAEADGQMGSKLVHITQLAARVAVAPRLDTLRALTRSVQLSAVALDDSGHVITTAKPRWTSADPAVVRVSAAGLATAESAGAARIVAQVGTAADTATLVVAQVVQFLFVTPELDTLTAIGDLGRIAAIAQDSALQPIPNPTVGWTTGDPAIATVDPTGLVTAVANGVVQITAASGGRAAAALVLVRQEVTSVRVSPDAAALAGPGDTVRLSASGLDHNGYPVSAVTFTWRSDAECVATVDTAGLVTARGDGTTNIVAAPKSGHGRGVAGVAVTGSPLEFIAFDSPLGIEVADAGTATCRRVLVASTYDYYYYSSDDAFDPAWSPDGARLAYVRSQADYYNGETYHGIVVAQSDGSSGVPLTGQFPFAGDPAWSPDGGRVAFAGDRQNLPCCPHPDIYVTNADGSNPLRLTQLGDAHGPTWSPSGSQLAFESLGDIYVVNADGTGLVRLTSTTSYDGQPAWSPNSQQIAFISDRVDHREVWLMNADGSEARQLTASAPTSIAADPAWAPDGTRLVYVINEDLYVMAADGTGQRSLTNTPATYEHHPAWRVRAAPPGTAASRR